MGFFAAQDRLDDVGHEGGQSASLKLCRPRAGHAAALSFGWSVSRVSGGLLSYPFVAAVLAWPTFLFQSLRHSLLARAIALPSCSVGFGYTYLSRGEVPPDTREEEIMRA